MQHLCISDERAGNLCVVTVDNETGERIRSQLKAIVRATWSNPPSHGARIVTAVLNNSAWLSQWYVSQFSFNPLSPKYIIKGNLTEPIIPFQCGGFST